MDRQKVLKILNDLKPHRELAEWMIALIDAWFMEEEPEMTDDDEDDDDF